MSDEPNRPVASRILIVEDEMIVAEDLALTLQDLGYHVVGMVWTGESAIQLTEESKPDLILMDINLGGQMDGIQTSKQIRDQFDIPVIFLSAYDETDVLCKAKETEPYGYLAKPFAHHLLKITIETALYKHAADKRVRESEARRAKAEELAGLHGWEWDFGTGQLVWSVQGYHTFGLPPNDAKMTFDSFIDAVHADDRDLVRTALGDAVDGKRPYKLEYRIVQPNGRERVLLSRGEVQRDSKGRPIRMQGMALDITDRKEAEKALNEQANLLRTLINGLPDIVALQRPDHSIIFYNQAGYDFLGKPPSEVNNRKCFTLIGRETICEGCATAKAIVSKQIESTERYFPETDSWLEARAIPVLDDRGNTSMIVEILRDIGDRKRHASGSS